MHITYLIEDFLDARNIQQWINNRFQSSDKYIIQSNFFKLFPILTMENGIKFYNSPEILSICEVFQDYQFSDIQRNDIVIDIGANAGGFSIPASKLSDHINSVEPLLMDKLKKNIELNQIHLNIIEGALGDGEKHEVSWGSLRKSVNTYSLSQLKEMSGGCDFLKCDCEGYEWFIRPEELNEVRRLEMELHNINPSQNDPYSLIDNITKNYETVLVSKTGRILEEFQMNFRKNVTDFMILHATRKT
jgi:FkbM family methyltransferase